ncbi:MAG: hypothetical protein ACR2NZ_11695, partial [Rubripirellula sp.]
GRKGMSSTKRLWIGFLVSPPVAPILLSAAIFIGRGYLLDSNDTGTPVGIILIPIFLLTLGIAVSYFLMLVIGMPLAFLLRRRSLLNGFTILLSAVAVSLFLGIAGAILIVTMNSASNNADLNFVVAVPFVLSTSFFSGVFAVTTAIVFWLVTCKFGGNKLHRDSLPA